MATTSTSEQPTSFDYLEGHDPIFIQLALAAERAFSSDPNTNLQKLRLN